MTSPDIVQALEIAAAGQSARAADLLERAASAGDADARYVLGLWRLEGQHLPRDLDLSRALIADAEAQGSIAAARTLSALIAAGIGAPADWQGAVALLARWSDRDPIAARQLALVSAMDLDADGDPRTIAAPEPVSASPRIAGFAGFLSDPEIRFLLDLAERRFKPALVFDESERRFIAHPYRDAHVAAFPVVFEWPAIHALNRRIAAASGTKATQGEPLQVLRYGPGQQYRQHLDAVPGLANQRVLTMLVALNDDFDGGATGFPEAGFEWRGRAGDALLFRNIGADGRPDQSAIHAGLPVTRGVKHIASRWIRGAAAPPGESFGQHEVLPSADPLRQ